MAGHGGVNRHYVKSLQTKDLCSSQPPTMASFAVKSLDHVVLRVCVSVLCG